MKNIIKKFVNFIKSHLSVSVSFNIGPVKLNFLPCRSALVFFNQKNWYSQYQFLIFIIYFAIKSKQFQHTCKIFDLLTFPRYYFSTFFYQKRLNFGSFFSAPYVLHILNRFFSFCMFLLTYQNQQFATLFFLFDITVQI